MPRFLVLVLAAVLIPLPLHAQEPADPPAQEEPEKKPDAFQYFFGKKREEKKAEPAKEAPAAEKPAEPVPQPEIAPEPEPDPRPAPVAPAPPKPAPPVTEGPKAEEPKADAFQYFFGRSTQPAEMKAEERKASGKKPRDAFEYFFGRDGKAGVDKEKPKSPPPSR